MPHNVDKVKLKCIMRSRTSIKSTYQKEENNNIYNDNFNMTFRLSSWLQGLLAQFSIKLYTTQPLFNVNMRYVFQVPFILESRHRGVHIRLIDLSTRKCCWYFKYLPAIDHSDVVLTLSGYVIEKFPKFSRVYFLKRK